MAWLLNHQHQALLDISEKRNGRHVIFYGSAFLQKPQVPPNTIQIMHEDLNGLMSVIHGMDATRGLTLVLHTPGGVTNAAESIVAYLRSKFSYIEVIVPTLAMSAGTMISLAADKVIMGRQSQLGPIDPQMPFAGKFVSARAVVEQFERATFEVLDNLDLAHVWAPILQTLGPSVLQEAQNALDYSEKMVARWATSYMFKGLPNATALGDGVARHFNDATTHKSHGRRIDRDEARANGVVVEDLEPDQALQDAALTAYHLMTIVFETTATTKLIQSDMKENWIKNHLTAEDRVAFIEMAKKQTQPGLVQRPPTIIKNRADRRRK